MNIAISSLIALCGFLTACIIAILHQIRLQPRAVLAGPATTTAVVFRVRGPFSNRDELLGLLRSCVGTSCTPRIHSFAVQADDEDKVATITFDTTSDQLTGLEDRTFDHENITIDRSFYGLTVLFSPGTSDHQLDIIAICGLGGHAFGSFKERDGTHMWLRDSLPKDFPHARIMTYGYDSHIHGSNSFQDFESLASSLRVAVEGIKSPTNSLRVKPIIFIAHSLGGLVLKEALIQSGQANSNLFRHTQGALFFGVPNEGMDIASLIPMVEDQPNEAFLHTLHPESELLRKQSRQFQEIFNSPATTIFSFYETKTSPTAKKGIDNKWRMNGDEVILVGSNSATHCRPWENKAHHVKGLNQDHSGLVKFSTRDHAYITVRNILSEVIGNQDIPPQQRSVVPGMDEDLTNTCLQDLLLTNPKDEMIRIEKGKDTLLKDCYQWIMEDDQLCDWRTDPSRRLLWLRGDPGKGKTMLMISLVRELQPSWNDSHTLTFFFCQNSDTNLNTATAVLRGLLWTLIREYPSLGRYLHTDFKHSGKKLLESSNAFFTLRRIMSELLQDNTIPTIYILVDALDECDRGREDLLKFICENAAEEKSKAKWLVSSRNHLDIEMGLGGNQHSMLSLELNTTHVEKAVHAFITHKIDELANKKRYTESLRNLVRKHLMDNAHSTFLWVALVCKRLESVHKYKTASELKRLPPELSPLYDRMLEQILEGEDSDLSTAIMRSIILAKRPLVFDELYALSDLPEEVMDDEQSLLDLVSRCASFATIRERTIYLIHQSVKDYFVTGEGQKIFTTGIAQENREIVNRSLCIMSTRLKKNICSLDSPGATPNINMPLPGGLRYICIFWIEHLEEYQAACGDSDGDNKEFLSYQGEVYKFLLRYLLNWLEFLALIGQLRGGISLLRRLEGLAKASITILRQTGTNNHTGTFRHEAILIHPRRGSICPTMRPRS
ncbi:hypothetical protein BP5796_12265 [Coleophoma crateriformis]|uniref:NACHT domain-containing protein n=1 Tax=Coleophoma crateriformis TaxID=565419 RepID=A0A3D8Q925_9HELO|nr:hypothetical protein BP5796_12265 [Coleophoma crateriformis]